MELWIRSQDRKSLIKSNGVGLTPSEISIYPIGLNGVLGTYETKERALEVLDEIQKLLKTAELNDDINVIVYQMPEK